MSIGAAQRNSPIGITKMLQNWSLVIKARQSARAPALVKHVPHTGRGTRLAPKSRLARAATQTRPGARPFGHGRPKEYSPDKLLPPLEAIWRTALQPCDVRRQACWPEWLTDDETDQHRLDPVMRQSLLAAQECRAGRGATGQGGDGMAEVHPSQAPRSKGADHRIAIGAEGNSRGIIRNAEQDVGADGNRRGRQQAHRQCPGGQKQPWRIHPPNRLGIGLPGKPAR